MRNTNEQMKSICKRLVMHNNFKYSMADKYRYIVDTSHDFITLINKNYVYGRTFRIEVIILILFKPTGGVEECCSVIFDVVLITFFRIHK